MPDDVTPSDYDEEQAARRTWDSAPDGVSYIGPRVIVSAKLNETADEAIAHLAEDRELYTRDGELVRVIRVNGDAPEAQDSTKRRAAAPKIISGTPIIRQVSRATLKERLAKHMNFFQRDPRTKLIKPVHVPRDVVEAVADRGEWPGFRPLAGVIETPSLRPDGSRIDEPGYDAATGYLYLPSRDYLPVPEAPTREEARAALAELADVFSDFPYSNETSRLVPIANLLTLIARPMIAGAVPAFIFDATTPGSGKTLQTDAVATIATGRGAARMSWPPDEVELEKVLAAYAIRGPAAIAFDNLSRPFCGAPIDKVLTAQDHVELRVLGSSALPMLRWRAVIMASGNNVQIQGDTARRVLISRLEPTEERPQDRDPARFRHPDLLAFVRSRRAELVRAALVVLGAWVAAGRPQLVGGSWGSFEAWTAIVPQAIAFAAPEPASDAQEPVSVLGARISVDEAAMADPLIGALPVVLSAIERLVAAGNGRAVTVKSILSTLYPADRRAGPPDGFDEARAALEELGHAKTGQPPQANRVGYALRRMRGRWFAGRRLESSLDRNGISLWAILRSNAGTDRQRGG